MANFSLLKIFILNQDGAFAHKYEFENWFAKKLAESSLEAKNINTGGEELFLIIKRKEVTISETPQINSPRTSTVLKSVKDQMKDLMPPSNNKQTIRADKFKKGRFLKTKGYLKK